MAKAEDESIADGLEIVSVGTLYHGPWDKKYWSSSRGKDRYPYPVGYHALRTQNGLTYKMEIHEGSAGPIFQITSSDGHYGSGQTPDIAWEAFHKKCSRMKLWHTKRFSCKVDGVEFFGFRNALVQRFLRELLAGSDGASDHSMSSVKFGNEPLAKDRDLPSAQLCEYPDLIHYLAKSRITGKRSRKHKTTSVNSTWKANDKENSIRNKTNDGGQNPVVASSFKEEYGICNGVEGLSSSVSSNPCKDVPMSATGLSNKSLQSSSGSVDKHYPAQLEVQLFDVGSHLTSIAVKDEHTEVKLDRLQCVEVQRVDPSIGSKHKYEQSQIVNDPEIFEDSEITKHDLLYAPDTLDTQQVDTSSPNINITEEPCKTKDDFGVGNTVRSGGPGAESCPDEETKIHGSNDSAEKSDFDSVGEEIAKSMMTVLLPQALPLLTYSSRKKKRKHNPMTVASGALRTGCKTKILPSVNVESSAGELVGYPNSDGQSKEDMPNIYPGSALQGTEIPVAHDSLENNRWQDGVTDQDKRISDAAEAVEANLGKQKSSPDKRRMLSTANSIIESGTCHSWTDLQRERERHILNGHHVPATFTSEKSAVLKCFQNGQSEADLVSKVLQPSDVCEAAGHDSEADKSHEDYTSILDSALGGASPGREVLESIDNGLHMDDTSRIIERHSRKGESSIASDRQGGWKQCNTLGHVDDLGIPVEQQPLSTVAYGPGRSKICQSSAAELFKRNFCGPRSESVICRNAGDHSLVVVNSCQQSPSVSDENKDTAASTASSPTKHLCDLLDEKMHESVTSINLEHNAKVIGCYSHPKRISSVMLKRELDNIYVCTTCGLLEENGRDLFIYKLQIKEPNLGCPSLIGHSAMVLPTLKDAHGREVAVERFGLQFTPDGGGLVLLDSIQVPCCSEQMFHCRCSTCASVSFEENGVKIVQVKQGFVSLLAKLKTLHSVNCILVCEPDCLVAVDESGRLYLWFMDPVWSGLREDYVIPSYDFVASRVVELKRIPKSAGLLVGHNGCGDFSLWDINKRTILSRYSAPACSILDFLPVSLFSWQSEGQFHGEHDLEECKKKLMAATTTWLSESNHKMTFQPMEGEEIGMWLLACTDSDSNCQPGCQPRNCQESPGSWRLGLLVKNTVILGTAFPRTAAIGVSAGHGIIGTDEGLAYTWNLQTGTKVQVLHNFKGVGVSHIVIDDSTPPAIAVAGENGQLWMYLYH